MRLVDRDQPAARVALARRLQDGRDGRGMVRVVVDQDDIALLPIDQQWPIVAYLEAPFDTAKACQRLLYRRAGCTHAVGRGECGQRVLDAQQARQLHTEDALRRKGRFASRPDAEARLAL